MKTFEEQKKIALSLIESAEKILIVPSTPVDGDSLGSAIALNFLFRKLGKKSEISYSFDRFSSFKFLPGAENIKVNDLYTLDLSINDLVVFIDGGNLHQFYDSKVHKELLKLTSNLNTLNIDHHPTNEHFAKNELWEPEASSTCEIVYKLFSDQQIFDRDIATNLYLGILTDTGRFKYSNTKPQVLRIAAQLLEYGVDVNFLTLNLDDTVPLKVLQFVGQLTSLIKVNVDYKYAYLILSQKIWKNKVTLEEMKYATNIIRDDFLRKIPGVDFVVCGKEEDESYIDLSFRTRVAKSFDLTKLAGYFGGGGHRDASGGILRGVSSEQAEEVLVKTIKEHFLEIKSS